MTQLVRRFGFDRVGPLATHDVQPTAADAHSAIAAVPIFATRPVGDGGAGATSVAFERHPQPVASAFSKLIE